MEEVLNALVGSWGRGKCGRGGEGWAICLYSSHKEIKSQCL